MKNISIADTNFAVHVSGDGPPLLLAHGFPLDHSMWTAQIGHFSATHQVIAPDLRGFGKTQSAQTHIITMQRMADDCGLILEQLGVTQPVTFCGLSMGGYVAWEFFRRQRYRLGKLILCDTRAIADDAETARARKVMAAHVIKQGLSALCESMLPKLLASDVKDSIRQLIRENILDNNPAHVAAVMRGLAARDDATIMLSEIDVPTLVLCGEQDAISPASEMKAIAENIPGSKFVEIASAGHMAPMENPLATNAAIEKFLGSN